MVLPIEREESSPHVVPSISDVRFASLDEAIRGALEVLEPTAGLTGPLVRKRAAGIHPAELIDLVLDDLSKPLD